MNNNDVDVEYEPDIMSDEEILELNDWYLNGVKHIHHTSLHILKSQLGQKYIYINQ